MPDVGEGLTEADILTWHVGPGDTVVVNQILVEIETAKAAVELPSPWAGTVGELLAILRITKQSLARVLGTLVDEGYVSQAPGRADRRQRLLSLTEVGAALERRLFERQRERLAAAYREAGGVAVDGFRRVMRAIMDGRARDVLDAGNGS